MVAQQSWNSNGNLVTRWVSSDHGEEKLLPVPVVEAPRPTIDEQRMRVAKVLTKARVSNYDDIPFLSKARDETITFLFDRFSAFDLEVDYYWEMDDDNVVEVANMVEDKVDEETVLAYLALYGVHEDALPDSASVAYVQGLHVLDRNRRPIDITSSDSVNRNAALLRFALDCWDTEELEHLIEYDFDAKAYVLASVGLAHFIYAHPDRVDEIREYVKKHYDLIKDRDSSGIEMMLESALVMSPLEEGRL